MSPPSGFPYNYYCPCHRRHPHQLQGINTIGVIMVLTVIIFIIVTILDQAVTTYKPHLSDIPVLPESSSPFWTRQWPHTSHTFHTPQSYLSHRHHSRLDSDHIQATPFTSPQSYLSYRHILDQTVTTYKPHLSHTPVLPESSSPFWTRQ